MNCLVSCESFPIFAAVYTANLSVRQYDTMAKARVTINPMYKGGAGGYSFYVRGGEQVIRQRKNNSNYGERRKPMTARLVVRLTTIYS